MDILLRVLAVRKLSIEDISAIFSMSTFFVKVIDEFSIIVLGEEREV